MERAILEITWRCNAQIGWEQWTQHGGGSEIGREEWGGGGIWLRQLHNKARANDNETDAETQKSQIQAPLAFGMV